MIEALHLELDEAARERSEWIGRLMGKPSGFDWCAAHTEILDRAIRRTYDAVVGSLRDAPELSLAATGGYGRREMCPWSDLDLTLIPADDAHPGIDAAVRALYNALHTSIAETFRIEVGYAYRLVNDATALDGRTVTSFLDARLVAGSPGPLEEFLRLFRESFPTAEFLAEKIEERRARHAEFHDTPLVVEPHLKEGAGGLRSFHFANWVRQAIGRPRLELSSAYDSVLAARNHLHAAAGKRTDVLSRQRQGELSAALGSEPSAWMPPLFQAMEELDGHYREALNLISSADYRLSPEIGVRSGVLDFEPKATLGERVVACVHATRLGLDVTRESAAGTSDLDGPVVLRALSAGELAIRAVDRAGLIDRLLPELAACRSLLPDDATHRFTVFEHTLRAIRVIDSLSPGSPFGDMLAELADRGPIYLALLLHDTGKAVREESHSEAGAQIAREVATRWKLASRVADTVEWLVREHLTMARLSRMRDVESPGTAFEFAAIVNSRERLDMLALLSYADMCAVSDSAMTPAIEHYLLELWRRTAAVLEAKDASDPEPAEYRRLLQRELQREPGPDEEAREFLESLPALYVISTPPEVARLHLRYAREAQAGNPVVDFQDRPRSETTDITVCCLDEPGLLSKLLGVLYAHDLGLHAIRVSTAALKPPVALDVFATGFGPGAVPPATSRQVAAALRRVIEKQEDVEDLLRAHGKDPDRMQEHFSFAYHDGQPGILEIQAPRGRGLAYRMSRLIARQGWNIVSSRIGQWAGRAAAAFYIVGPDGEPIPSTQVQAALGPKV